MNKDKFLQWVFSAYPAKVFNHCSDVAFFFAKNSDKWYVAWLHDYIIAGNRRQHSRGGLKEMSEPKFTLGPWYVDHGVPGKPRVFSQAKNLIKTMVCACEHGAISRMEHDANLIAAAPEMYDMLERILDYMTGGQFLAKPPSVEEIAHLLEKARGER